MVKTFLLCILLIGVVSALDIQSGETINITLEDSYKYYSVVGNSSDIDLNISQNGNIVFISFGKYIQSNSFSIIFFNSEQEVIHHYSSGGSTRWKTKYVDRNVTIKEYLDKNIIEYINQTQTPEPETIIKNKIPFWIYLTFGIVLGSFTILLIFLKKKKHRVIRRSKKKK